ncbi:hypothetical protein FCV25MIE_34130 [Fagus crenata]
MVAVGCNMGEGGGGRGGSRCQWRCKVAYDRYWGTVKPRKALVASELWVGDGGAMSRSGSCGSGMGLNHGGFECFLEVRFGGSVWNT